MTPVVFFLVIANLVCFGIEAFFGTAIVHNPVILNFALWPIGSGELTGGQVSFMPWQLVTYSFLHDPENLAHIAFNLYGLYLFGCDIERTLGSKRFAWLYAGSVVAAGLAQLVVVTMSVSGGIGPTLGASGGVFGVLLTFGLLFPRRQLMLIIPPVPIRAWLLVTIYGVIELVTGLSGRNTGVAHFAHLGGMVGAFIALVAFGGYKRFQRRDYE